LIRRKQHRQTAQEAASCKAPDTTIHSAARRDTCPVARHLSSNASFAHSR
jgi:hypothetical protein